MSTLYLKNICPETAKDAILSALSGQMHVHKAVAHRGRRILRLELFAPREITVAEREKLLQYLRPMFPDWTLEFSIHADGPAEMKKPAAAVAAKAVLQGRAFPLEKVISITNLSEGTAQCTVRGEVFFQDRQEKPNCVIQTAGIYDGTGSVFLKWLMRTGEKGPKPFETGSVLIVKGKYEYDPFLRGMAIRPTDVMKEEQPVRQDEAVHKRVELHLHTRFSDMDALCDVGEAIRMAAKLGHRAIAITDHGVVQAFPEAMLACGAVRKEYPDFKVIYGCEVYFVPEGEEAARYHMILLAATQAGLKNLYRIISESHIRYYYAGRGGGRPCVPKALLDANRGGLLVGSACEASQLFRAVEAGRPQEELLAIAGYYDFLEIQPIGNNAFLLRDGRAASEETLRGYNKTILELGKTLGKPVVATGDVHFLKPQDAAYRAVLQASHGYEDADEQALLYYRTTEEMIQEFSYLSAEDKHGVVVRWPNEIAGAIDPDIQPIPMGKLFTPTIEGSEEQLAQRVWARAHAVFGPALPALVKERLQTELDGIIGAGYAVLYVIAQKLVENSEQNGYLVGSRGSVGSSAVAHFAGISEVNPLPPHYLCPGCRHAEFIIDGRVASGFDLPEQSCPVCGMLMKADGHDIPFETFLGFGGNKAPDIDLNFSGEYQAMAHKYTEELFGRENVFRAGTVSALQEKTARAYAYTYLTKRNLSADEAEIIRLAQGITGVKKTTGQHPGGMVVLPRGHDIYDFTPVQYPANDKSKSVITTHFEFSYLHDTLLKLDALGHVVPTLYRYLEDITGIPVTDAPMNDPAVYGLLTGTEALGVTAEEIGSETGTFGIPELGTPMVRQMLMEARPKNFGDLIQISGLSHGEGVWKGNAQALIQSGKCTISDVIGTRDSIMLYFLRKGVEPRQAFEITEQVRKGKVAKAGFAPGVEEMLKAHGVPGWYLESCKKIQYMFPKAHAVAYLIAALRLGWYKVHHPKAFYAAYFSARGKGMEYAAAMAGRAAVKRQIAQLTMPGKGKGAARDEEAIITLQLVNEAMCRGISFLPVELGKSMATKYSIEESGIRMPYAAIAGIGEAAASMLEGTAQQKEAYPSVEALMQHTGVTSGVAEALVQAGVLAGMKPRNQVSLFEKNIE